MTETAETIVAQNPTWPEPGKIKCKWCGGSGMQTRNDLAEHPDDVGRMYRCAVCKGKETVETHMTDEEYRAIARAVYAHGAFAKDI